MIVLFSIFFFIAPTISLPGCLFQRTTHSSVFFGEFLTFSLFFLCIASFTSLYHKKCLYSYTHIHIPIFIIPILYPYSLQTFVTLSLNDVHKSLWLVLNIISLTLKKKRFLLAQQHYFMVFYPMFHVLFSMSTISRYQCPCYHAHSYQNHANNLYLLKRSRSHLHYTLR